MYCSGCGQAIEPGQGFCSQCGRPAVPPVSVVPGFQFQLEGYAAKIKTLSIVWFIYAGLSLALSLAGLAFASAFLSGHEMYGPWMHGHWMHGPWSGGLFPMWLGSAMLPFVWIFLFLRTGLVLAAAWGLWQRSQWGRIVAIVAAILSLLKFPLGTALGVWTLVVLLGNRNTALYQQL